MQPTLDYHSDTMRSEYDALYLSPHLDDAALSCGGQIFLRTEGGQSVLVVTIMAGQPRTDTRSTFADFLHHNWGVTAETAVARRRAEDETACRRLGADTLHWSVPDCIYRVHPETGDPLYTSDEALFGDVDEAEEYLVQEIVEAMNELPDAPHLFVPLTAGHHVDHQLTRKAAERYFGRERLIYYEDFPYVQRHPDAVDALVGEEAAWKPDVIPLTEEALQARLEASLAYKSQIGTLFNDPQALTDNLHTYVEEVSGERVWRPPDTS